MSRHLAALLVLAGAVPAHAGTQPGGIRVLAMLPPQADLVRRIASPSARVESLVPRGAFPHTFEPTPHQLTRLDGVRLVVTSGLPFEDRLLERIRAVTGEEAVVVPPPPGAPPHFWVDPEAALEQARRVTDALVALDPSHRGDYERGFAHLTELLETSEREIAQALAPCRGATVVTMHGALEPFLRRFGLEQLAIERGGKEPGPRRLAEVIEAARAAGVRAVLVEPHAGRRAAEAVAAAIGARVLLADPLFADYVQGLDALARTVAAACGAGATP